MAKSIHDSDTIPTDRDKQVASDILRMDSGEFDTEKMAHELVRLRRKELMQSEVQSRMDETLTTLGGTVNMLEGKLDVHIQRSNENHQKVMTTMQGDGTPVNRGIMGALDDCNTNSDDVKCMMTELTTRLTGKPPTTDHHKKNEAIEPNETSKYVYMGVGIVVCLVFCIGTLIAVWPYITAK